MRWFFFLIILVSASTLGLFIIGSIFYIGIEIFFYFYGSIPITLEIYQFERLLKMGIAGGGILGFGITALRFFKVKGF
ncbi:hypothetical protein E2L00_11190 [Cedecea colo]|uniref:Uncharacterized protein n=1 Tax=Cedecea colo TaxID=2552946 RepID=A0ABX0VM21_9ENTR|nr:hypothetical protein [Cedecea colo]